MFYRFVPREPGRLSAGGRLQAMVIEGRPSMDTRNWIDPALERPAIRPGERLTVRWIDLDDPEAPNDDLRFRAFADGAARFARGEGIWTGADAVHFACTTGGIGRLRSSPPASRKPGGRSTTPASIELFVEAETGGIIRTRQFTVDDGDLFVNGMVPDGMGSCGSARRTLERFAATRVSISEMASPDGRTMFVNIQAGLTLAIDGPWSARLEPPEPPLSHPLGLDRDADDPGHHHHGKEAASPVVVPTTAGSSHATDGPPRVGTSTSPAVRIASMLRTVGDTARLCGTPRKGLSGLPGLPDPLSGRRGRRTAPRAVRHTPLRVG